MANKYFEAFVDGIYTGGDFIGLAIMQTKTVQNMDMIKTGWFDFPGYTADKKGLSNFSDEPIQRGVLEQMLKGVGTSLGLLLSPLVEYGVFIEVPFAHFVFKREVKKGNEVLRAKLRAIENKYT